MTVVQDEPSWVWRSVTCFRWRTLEKNERPLETWYLTTRTVMQDRPSWRRRSVTCVRWGTLAKKMRDPQKIGSLTTGTVVQDGPSWVRRSVTCVRWDRVLGLLQRTLQRSVVGTMVRHWVFIWITVIELRVPYAYLMNPHQTCSNFDLNFSNPTT